MKTYTLIHFVFFLSFYFQAELTSLTIFKKYPDPVKTDGTPLPITSSMIMSFMIYKGGPSIPKTYTLGTYENLTSTNFNATFDIFGELFTSSEFESYYTGNSTEYNKVTNYIADNIVSLYRDQAKLLNGHTNNEILHLAVDVIGTAKPNVLSATLINSRISTEFKFTGYNDVTKPENKFDWNLFTNNLFFPTGKRSIVATLSDVNSYIYDFGFGFQFCKKYQNWAEYTNTLPDLLQILTEDFNDVIKHWASVYAKKGITNFYFKSVDKLSILTISLTDAGLKSDLII